MTTYVALLRGIGPGNPNMRNERLRAACDSLGLANVSTVISSGNVVFETESTDVAELESILESAWRTELGFESTTILRSRRDLESLVELAPFGHLEHGRQTYLLVTFSKAPLPIDFPLPHRPEDSFQVVAATERELFTVTDTTIAGTPEAMAWVESRFGTGVSSRTWLTVGRILKRMG